MRAFFILSKTRTLTCSCSKFYATLAAMERNALDDSGLDAEAEVVLELSTTQSDPVHLVDDSGELWHGSIQVGTPPIMFTGKFWVVVLR